MKLTLDSFIKKISFSLVKEYETDPKSILSGENLNLGAVTCPKHVKDNNSVDPSNLHLKVSLNSPGIVEQN